MAEDQMIVEVAERSFRALLSPQVREGVLLGQFPDDLWQRLEEAGLVAAAVSEARGGLNLWLRDCCAIAKMAGRFAAPVPLVESFLAEAMLAEAHLKPASGIAVILPPFNHGSITLHRSNGQAFLNGSVKHIPWLSQASHLVAIALEDQKPVTLCIPGPFKAQSSENVAGEPTGAVVFRDAAISEDHIGKAGRGFDPLALHTRGALFRCAQMIGAMQAVLDMTTSYAKERTQFGRPIGKFQAVQQQIAMMASDIVAADCAFGAAVEAAQAGQGSFEIAVAKSRFGKAVDLAVDVSHQIHGAIGTTREFPLHHYTMRLAMWRNEFGTPHEWSERIGEIVCRLGGDRLWPYLTAKVR